MSAHTFTVTAEVRPDFGVRNISVDFESEFDGSKSGIWLRTSGHGFSSSSALTIEQAEAIACGLLRAVDERRRQAEVSDAASASALARLAGVPV